MRQRLNFAQIDALLRHSALIAPDSVSTVTEKTLADVVLPTYCGCNELLENIEQLETHVERGCWRKSEERKES